MKTTLLAAALVPLSCTIAFAQSVTTRPTLDGAVVVHLAPNTDANRRLGWSPKGATVPLKAVGATLQGHFPLGAPGLPPINVELRKSNPAGEVDALAIDLNRNGAFEESELLTCQPNENRGKWWSSFSTSVPVPVLDPWGEMNTTPYPINLWYVRDPLEPDAAPALRWSRGGFFTGNCRLGSADAFIMICESDMDGVLDRDDAWGLAPASDPKEALGISGMRSLTDHAWLGEQAYRIAALDASGLLAVIVPTVPGITRASEAEARDRLAVDRRAARSGPVVAFSHDFAAAQAESKAKGKRLFIDFETDWCGPCKQMDRWVYTADDVVAVSKDLIAVKVDGDASRDLVKQFNVGAYPTMILLDASGREIVRNVGYIGVKETTEFLKSGAAQPHN